jgi:hypothetical protein
MIATKAVRTHEIGASAPRRNIGTGRWVEVRSIGLTRESLQQLVWQCIVAGATDAQKNGATRLQR